MRFGQLSTVKLARLEEDLERLSISEFDDIIAKLGYFTRIKNLLEEFGSHVSNPIHKLLGKLPTSFEHFKDTIYLRQPFPSFEETVSLLHDKCLTHKHNKPDSALVAQGKGKGKAKFFKENKSKKAPSSDSKERLCDFCGRTGHLEEKCFAKRDASKKLKVKKRLEMKKILLR